MVFIIIYKFLFLVYKKEEELDFFIFRLIRFFFLRILNCGFNNYDFKLLNNDL